MRQVFPVAESVLAREILAPLGGLVEIGAVVATGTWNVGAASLGGLVRHRRAELDRLLELIRETGDFSPVAMGIADELGYLREHEVTAPSLFLWSGGLEAVPSRIEELERPQIVRRMCLMGADLQLTHFLQALVTAAIVAGTEVRQGAAMISEMLGIAVDLVGAAGRSAPAEVFRMWRVVHLPAILRPDSDAPESGKAGFRAYDRALEELLVVG
ncbi:hypothetical protein ACFY1L_07035 [Streptomyces sp. NPDC001663]|uniref:hypothetical protein n=1 Tax=Streptomyces sp. NPDC001663 TaxID=3364597 RepID=UPI003677AB01